MTLSFSFISTNFRTSLPSSSFLFSCYRPDLFPTAENILLEGGPSFSSNLNNQGSLHPIDQAVLLALCLDVENSNPQDGLTYEEMFPYVTRVLQLAQNWMIHSTGNLLIEFRFNLFFFFVIFLLLIFCCLFVPFSSFFYHVIFRFFYFVFYSILFYSILFFSIFQIWISFMSIYLFSFNLLSLLLLMNSFFFL